MKKGNKQLERQQRGEEFEAEIRRSWTLVPETWRMRIPDGKGGTRPADALTLCSGCNILAEMKRTEGDRFELSFLRPNQARGLLAFDQVLPQNYGLVLVSFKNDEAGRDTAYAFRLITALKYMKAQGRKYITLEEFERGRVPSIRMQRVEIDGKPGYDLKGVALCYKYL